MKIDFEDRAWQVELDDVDMAQGEVIAAYTGLSIMGWRKSLIEAESLAWAKSMRCLYWLMWQQNPQHGAGLPVETLNFKPVRLMEAFLESAAAEVAAAETQPEDPTLPAAGPGAAELTPPPTAAG